MVWVIFSVFIMSCCQEPKVKTQPESGGSEGLVDKDVVVSPKGNHAVQALPFPAVREDLEEPFGRALESQNQNSHSAEPSSL